MFRERESERRPTYDRQREQGREQKREQGRTGSRPRSQYNRARQHQENEAQAREVKRRVGKAQLLTDRDMAIIRRIAKGGVMSLEQARQVFWRKEDGSLAARTTAQTRLGQLVGAGYLRTDYTHARRPGEQVYSLTRQGANLLTPLERARAAIGLPGQNEIRQQLDAQNVRINIERDLAGRGAQLLDWKTEHDLRSEQTREIKKLVKHQGRKLSQAELDQLPDIADAQAVIEDTSGQIYGLNVEIDGQYFGQMLKNKIGDMHRLSQQTGLPVVWATTGSPNRAARLNREIDGAGASQTVRIIEVEDY
jgi:hypothetical protein